MRVQKQTKRVLYWGITLVLMILIFSFSAKNGTSSAEPELQRHAETLVKKYNL